METRTDEGAPDGETLPLDPHQHARVKDRLLLLTGAVLSFVIFWWVGALVGVPANKGYSASLIQQPMAWLMFVAVAITFVVCVGLSSLVAGSVHFDAGFACAAAGLSALSMRGGPMRYALMASPGRGVFIGMSVELLLLYGVLALGWMKLMALSDKKYLKSEELRWLSGEADEVPSQGALAIASQVMLMLFLMSILCQTDKKGQVIAAVGISAFLATLGAHSVFPTRPSAWFWCGPLVAGLMGYLFAYWGDGDWTTGEVYGWSPQLGRPLPLDYATAGPVGALLGYWVSRRWHLMRETESEPGVVVG